MILPDHTQFNNLRTVFASPPATYRKSPSSLLCQVLPFRKETTKHGEHKYTQPNVPGHPVAPRSQIGSVFSNTRISKNRLPAIADSRENTSLSHTIEIT